MWKFDINNLVEVNGLIGVVTDRRRNGDKRLYSLKFMDNKNACWFFEDILNFVHKGYDHIVKDLKEGR